MSHRTYKVEIYEDSGTAFRWRLLGANGETMAQGESHTRRSDAVRAVDTVATAFASLVEKDYSLDDENSVEIELKEAK